MVRSVLLALLVGLFGLQARADPRAEIFERTASLAELFAAERAKELSNILPVDRAIRCKLRLPDRAEASGVLIFITPDGSAEPRQDWSEVLDRRNLIWAAPEDFGNEIPTAQRILAALMSLALVQRDYVIDSKRIYVAGMSGGGRVASRTITKFPQMFTGAIYIVGVDFWTHDEESFLPQIASNRYVFITGDRDFNRRETRRIHHKYRHAGAQKTLLLDLPQFGHEYPDAKQLGRALEFLDMGTEALTR